MSYPERGQYIDMQAHRLVAVEDISRRLVGLLTEADALRFLDDEDTMIFRWDYDKRLSPVLSNDKASLRGEVAGHVTNASEDFDLTQFTNGYCFIASHWKGAGGKSILVLHCQH